MSRPRMFHDEIHEQNMHFLAAYFEMRNCSLMILSEGEDQLGTLAVAIPPTTGLITGTTEPLSSILLGDRNFLAARMIAERLSVKTQKIALVSITLRTVTETEASPVLLRLAEKIMESSQKTNVQQTSQQPSMPPHPTNLTKSGSTTAQEKEGTAL